MKGLTFFMTQKSALFSLILLLLNFDVSFAQNNDLEGIWYYMDNQNSVYIRIFSENQTLAFNFGLSLTSGYSLIPDRRNFKNYTIDGGRLNIDGRAHDYRTSSQMLIIWETSRNRNWAEPYFYHPVLEVRPEALIGSWVVIGDEYDIEVIITNNTLIFRKGKSEREFQYSVRGFPVITFRDSSGREQLRNYFFFGKNILSLLIPGEDKALIFQRRDDT
jgi:hypothetical protein